MMQAQTQSGFSIEGRITARTHNEEDLRDAAEDYESLSAEERLELTREVEPEREFDFTNTVVNGLLEYVVDNLDPDQTNAKDNVSVSHLGLGTNNDEPDVENTDLNNRQFKKSVTDITDNSSILLTSTFIDSNEATGLDLKELGLYTGDPANLGDKDVFLLNHSTFNTVAKTGNETVTFDVELRFGAA
jgi:hypothetical protein